MLRQCSLQAQNPPTPCTNLDPPIVSPASGAPPRRGSAPPRELLVILPQSLQAQQPAGPGQPLCCALTGRGSSHTLQLPARRGHSIHHGGRGPGLPLACSVVPGCLGCEINGAGAGPLAGGPPLLPSLKCQSRRGMAASGVSSGCPATKGTGPRLLSPPRRGWRVPPPAGAAGCSIALVFPHQEQPGVAGAG